MCATGRDAQAKCKVCEQHGRSTNTVGVRVRVEFVCSSSASASAHRVRVRERVPRARGTAPASCPATRTPWRRRASASICYSSSGRSCPQTRCGRFSAHTVYDGSAVQVHVHTVQYKFAIKVQHRYRYTVHAQINLHSHNIFKSFLELQYLYVCRSVVSD